MYRDKKITFIYLLITGLFLCFGIGTGSCGAYNTGIVHAAAKNTIPDAAYPTKVKTDKENKIVLTWKNPRWSAEDGSRGIVVSYNKNGWCGEMDIMNNEFIPSETYEKKVYLKTDKSKGSYSVRLSKKAATDVKIRYYERRNGKVSYGKAKIISVFTPDTKLPYPYRELAPAGDCKLKDRAGINDVKLVEVKNSKPKNIKQFYVESDWLMEEVPVTKKSYTVKNNSVYLSYNLYIEKKNCFIHDNSKRKNARTYLVGTAAFKVPAARQVTSTLTIAEHAYDADCVTGTLENTEFTLKKSVVPSYHQKSVYTGTIKFSATGYDGKQHKYSLPFTYYESSDNSLIPEGRIKITYLRSNKDAGFKRGSYSVTTDGVNRTFLFEKNQYSVIIINGR